MRARNDNAVGSERDLAIEVSSARSMSVSSIVLVGVYAFGMRHLQGCLNPCSFCAYELGGQDTIIDRQVHGFPSDATIAVFRAVSSDAVTQDVDASEPFGVDVQQLAGRGAFAALLRMSNG
jgi:hypothetical protein